MKTNWIAALHAAALICAGVSTQAAQGPTWQNPITVPNESGSGVADVQIYRFRGYYYLYATGGDVRVWTSTDLANWTDRGLCLVGPTNSKAWSPRILYYAGTFYLYGSGDTNGVKTESVYSSSSPLGPFTLVKGTLMNCIDGFPFLDNDGQLYFYYAAGGGISYRKMTDPLNVSSTSSQLTSCVIHADSGSNWTESPHVFNLDGTYYMTYSGNDWTQNDYQVHIASGSSPTTLSAQSTGNPVLIQTTGTWVSSGCADIFRGPDLKTLIAAYSVRNGSDRKLCIDRMELNTQGNLVVDGPTLGVAESGNSLADFSDYFNRSTIGANYTNVSGGNWSMNQSGSAMSADSRGQTDFKKELCNVVTASDYVVEVTTKLNGKGTQVQFPKYAVVVSSNGSATSETGFYVCIDDTSKVIATVSRINNVWGTWQNSALPQWDMTKYHTLRIAKNGNTFQVFFDGMLKQARSVSGLGAGQIGFATQDCAADFGWFSWSNQTSTTSQAQRFEAESLAVPSSSGPGYRIVADSAFSGGSGVIVDSTAIGNAITFLAPNIAAGTYEIQVGGKNLNTRGVWQLSIGRADSFATTAKAVGAPQDEYGATPVYTTVDLGTWSPTSTNDKWFQFQVTGKNASSTGYTGCIDYIKLTPQ